jgi:hypothetical protein
MSSVHSYIRQTNTLFTNGKDMINSILLSDASATPAWVSAANSTIQSSIRVAGNAVFRDMGKLVYLPGNPATGSQVSTVLRKVQLVPQGIQTGQGVGTAADGLYYVGYVNVGGTNGVSGGLVRIN